MSDAKVTTNAEVELTTGQIARVFAMYIGQRVADFDGLLFILRGVSVTPHNTIYLHAVPKFDGAYYPSQKLILRPLSAITDEDAVIIATLLKMDVDRVQVFAILTMIFEMPVQCGTDTLMRQFEPGEFALISQCLIQLGYALPLFFAPGHPLNGKDAIQIGLAIDSTAQEGATNG